MLKLSRLADMRKRAEIAIDLRYRDKFEHILGRVPAVHAMKLQAALLGTESVLVDDEDDRIAIIENAQKQQVEIAELDRERRALKNAVRSLATSVEIETYMQKRGFTVDAQ